MTAISSSQPTIDKTASEDGLIQSDLSEPSALETDCSTPTLLPLRDRDLKVLVDLFTLDDIDAIETDILTNLNRRPPEPCWEDDPFEFLRDYL